MIPGRGAALLLLAICAVAVVALAAGVELYRSLLAPAEAPVGGALAAVSIGLLVALAAAAVWLTRGRGGRREPELERRLWEAIRDPAEDGERGPEP
jgi:hypothetical protein